MLTPVQGRALGHPIVVIILVASRSSWQDPARALHLRHRRQPRGGPSGRHPRGPGSGRSRSRSAASRPDWPPWCTHRVSGSLSVGFDGGTYVLYAVAAAVIGGASLFGGYGKPIHPLLGGLVIATLTNGLALLNISTAGTDIATAAVLLVAVAVDATLRRRGRPS